MIRPSVKSGSGKSGAAGGFEGGREESGLDVLGVTVGIEAEFGEVNGAVTGEVVKAREVACERFAVFEVNVEGGEVCRGWLEVFGGGEISVADGDVGCHFLAGADEAIEGLADFPRSHPAGHVGRDFVSNENRAQTGVIFVAFEPSGEIASGLVEEAGILRDEVTTVSPGVSGDDDKVVLSGAVQEMAIREGINADGIESGGTDLREVFFRRVAGGLRKGSISDGTKKVRSSIEMEVLSVDRESHKRRLEEESVGLQFGVG